ncbi:alpha,alpha-trehalase TreF [Robbsia andropogonis]|uniref:alpha,alpha-trehalase TreF n=1 Tax=Robbsia andropogonis TaxID=28092 RepID=UPI00209D248C|nr:alpha,alpha-trehalase TreF [Robbsia andropogonis]MCP1117309.1 alpha,alpha-trehalase TreF [Robbsia andropogonis]MCP1129296.1 alpha,alpha-trehalase TreF [Robbsia andropogonis]
MTHRSTKVLAQGGKAPGVEHVVAADGRTPADRYQEMFVAIQQSRVFPDSKTFVDCQPLRDPQSIVARYRENHALPGFDLRAFVADHFITEPVHNSHYVSDPAQPIGAHIDALWDVLTRTPDSHPANGSLLPVPFDYVVPGGRFGEMYYWDSYFTMLGMAESGRHGLLRNMADNFAFLIDAYGHIPNGNRSYYLSRSQPPVFALMVDLFEEHGLKRAVHFLPQLLREHAFWMEGAEDTLPGNAYRHVVRMEDGALLNRYWDERDTPRDEGFLEDIEAGRLAGVIKDISAHGTVRTEASGAVVTPETFKSELFRDLRAGAASGWDFSSRWLADPDDLSTIRTTAILPVDLNSFLYKLETQISRLSGASGDEAGQERFRGLAEARRVAVDRYLWSDLTSAYVDYDWKLGKPREELTAAAATPLYVGLATQQQAHQVAQAMSVKLLAPGGLMTTERDSPQQWDRANGWAPLQWLAIKGLRRYNQRELAQDIAHRWLDTVGALYRRESKLVEKYALHADNVSDPHDVVGGGGGGEYPLQDGFGWTNGVTRKLLAEHPSHRTHQACAGEHRHGHPPSQ